MSEPEETAVFDFDLKFQRKIAALALRDPIFARKTEGLIKPEYFESDADAVICNIANDYYNVYKKVPDPSSIPTILRDAISTKKIRSDMIGEVKSALKDILTMKAADAEYVTEKVHTFAKHRALENAIMESVGALDKGNYDKIEELIKKANSVGNEMADDGYDYAGEIENRTQYRNDLNSGKITRDGITTGVKEIDNLLYHNGWGKKELSVIMGAAKAGKSMSLGEFAKNAMLVGKSVLYITCEVSAEIISERLDANISSTRMGGITKTADDVMDKVRKITEGRNKMKIHEYPSGSLKVSQLRRLMQYHRDQGRIFDLVVVDYADIMCPEMVTDNQVENMRRIYIDLRAIASEFEVAVLTATQTNRDGAKAAVAKMTDVADDFNKIRTADLVISINSTEDERNDGIARLYMVANRNGIGDVTIEVSQDRAKMQFIKRVIEIHGV